MEIDELFNEYETARKKLMNALRRKYPVGSDWIHRKSGNPVRIVCRLGADGMAVVQLVRQIESAEAAGRTLSGHYSFNVPVRLLDPLPVAAD